MWAARERKGATSLAASANQCCLQDGKRAGPSLRADGAEVETGKYGAWAPISAEKTSTGYEMAFKVAGSDQYALWSTDSSGAYPGNIVGVVPGSNSTLQSSEKIGRASWSDGG